MREETMEFLCFHDLEHVVMDQHIKKMRNQIQNLLIYLRIKND